MAPKPLSPSAEFSLLELPKPLPLALSLLLRRPLPFERAAALLLPAAPDSNTKPPLPPVTTIGATAGWAGVSVCNAVCWPRGRFSLTVVGPLAM